MKGGGKIAPTIDDAEWNFEACPPEEREECFQWEMARESRAIREDVRQLRRSVDSQTFPELFAKLRPTIFSGPLSPRPMAVFWFCPEFPSKPYLLSMDARTRADRIRDCFGDEDEARAEDKARASLLDGRKAIIPADIGRRIRAAVASRCPVYRCGSRELAVLEIEWHEHDAIIRKHFEAWLRENRPKDVEIWPYNGAGTPTRQRVADLKSLGAWRLLTKWNMSPGAAAVFSQANSRSGKPLYAEEKEWRDAMGRITKELAEFERTFLKFNQRVLRKISKKNL